MANVKISDLTPATQVKDTDQVEINQGGSPFSATKQQVAGYVTQYDISAGNQTETLPDAATYPGLTYTAIVTGGDGTFDFQWVATDDIIRDGNVETPAHEAVQGEGVTTVIAKGGDWVTVEYEDYLATATGNINKRLADMVIDYLDSTTYTTSSAVGNVFRIPTAQNYTFPKAFAAVPAISQVMDFVVGSCWWSTSGGVVDTTDVWVRSMGPQIGNQCKQGYTARGKW